MGTIVDQADTSPRVSPCSLSTAQPIGRPSKTHSSSGGGKSARRIQNATPFQGFGNIAVLATPAALGHHGAAMFARLGNLDAQRLVGCAGATTTPACGARSSHQRRAWSNGGGVVRVRQDLDPATDAIGGAHMAHFDEIVGQAVGEQQRCGQLAGLGGWPDTSACAAVPCRFNSLRPGALPVTETMRPMRQARATTGRAPWRQSGSGLGGLLDQAGNRRRQLGANALPVRQAVLHQAQAFFLAGGERVIETNALDETAIATVARVSGNDIEEGALRCRREPDGLRPSGVIPRKTRGVRTRNARVQPSSQCQTNT